MNMVTKMMSVAGAACALSGCLPTDTQETITVNGEATIMSMPDSFTVRVEVEEAGEDKNELLEVLRDLNNKMLNQLGQGTNATELKIETLDLEIMPIRSTTCLADSSREYDDLCPITSYSGYIFFEIHGSPADEAGNVVSFATSLGADSARIYQYWIRDALSIEKQAQVAAIQNARQKADLLVSGAGASLGKVVKIQSGYDFSPELDLFNGEVGDTITVTGSRIISLPVNPAPVEYEGEVTVAFEIIQDTE